MLPHCPACDTLLYFIASSEFRRPAHDSRYLIVQARARFYTEAYSLADKYCVFRL